MSQSPPFARFSFAPSLLVVAAALVAPNGCSSSDSTPPASSTSADASAATDGSSSLPDGGTTPVDGASATPTDAGADAAATAGRGITVTVSGTTHELTVNPRASLAGNGYAVQAGKVSGSDLYGVTLTLVKADASDAGAANYVEPVPGAYQCQASVPPVPYLWARVQYTSPDGVYQYGDPAPCVTLTAFGAVGQPVKGSFSATVQRVSGSGPASLTVSGTFDVDRTN